jgi:hypothetical protein
MQHNGVTLITTPMVWRRRKEHTVCYEHIWREPIR